MFRVLTRRNFVRIGLDFFFEFDVTFILLNEYNKPATVIEESDDQSIRKFHNRDHHLNEIGITTGLR